MSNFLFYLGAFALALGLLIVVHEAGHFALARWCGVKVLRFSVGFGKPLLSCRFGRDQTELALAA
ncbi:MAG: RIP metalloprotease RseP, partial [Chloroflexi bacterium]